MQTTNTEAFIINFNSYAVNGESNDLLECIKNLNTIAAGKVAANDYLEHLSILSYTDNSKIANEAVSHFNRLQVNVNTDEYNEENIQKSIELFKNLIISECK